VSDLHAILTAVDIALHEHVPCVPGGDRDGDEPHRSSALTASADRTGEGRLESGESTRCGERIREEQKHQAAHATMQLSHHRGVTIT